LDEDYNMNLKDTVDVANATLEDESPQLERWEEAVRRADEEEGVMLEEQGLENNK
jgi:hypothetical protein